MNLFTFRLDEIGDISREQVKQFLSQKTSRHVVSYEISEKTQKPHYQGWVYVDCSRQVFQNRIKDNWPIIKVNGRKGPGNGKYSCAIVKNYDNYVKYCLKGTKSSLPDIVSMQLGINETLDVAEKHREFWAERQIVQETYRKEQHIVDRAVEYFQNYSWDDEEQKYVEYRRIKVSKYIITELKRTSKSQISGFAIRNWANAVCLQIDPDFEAFFLAETVNRF